MLRTEMSKTVKAVIFVLTFLMAPLAQDAWARSDRGDSGRSKDSSSKQQSERSSVQARTPTSSPEARRTIREAPRGDAPAQRVSREPQRQDAAPVVKRPDVVRTQPQMNNPAPASRPAPVVRPDNAPKFDNRIADQGRPARVESSRGKPAAWNGRTGNRDGVKVNETSFDRRKPTDVVRPLANTTNSWINRNNSDVVKPATTHRQALEDAKNSGSISPATTHRQALENAKISEQTVKSPGNSDRENRDRRPNTDRRGEPRTPDQTRNHDWNADRQTLVRENHADRRDFVRSNRNTILIGRGDHDFNRFRPARTSRVEYEDRTFDRSHHHDYVFRDRHNRLNYSIISPRFSFALCYNWGRYHSVRYAYPYYNRRYIFVSLGGFWPDYSCVRYYWYPAHSYWWYGYYPVAQEVGGDTYNYYTYNYYDQPTTTAYDSSAATNGIATVDETTFADVREKLARQQASEPAPQTDADTLFDEGVKTFGQGSYAEAEEKFARAMALAPDDLILPFAYAQALLAQGKYTAAADILRVVVQKSTPDKQGVFFPRGLYLDENTLDGQIDQLSAAAANNPADTDMQLLLGYQLLGIGQTDKAIVSLNAANTDGRNFATVNVLLDLAEKINSGENK